VEREEGRDFESGIFGGGCGVQLLSDKEFERVWRCWGCDNDGRRLG